MRTERGIENKIGRVYYTGQGRRQGELGEEKIMEAVAIKLWVQNVREGN